MTDDSGEPEGIGRVGLLKEPVRYHEFARRVKKAMEIETVRCFGNDDPVISRVAVSGGAGRSVVDLAIEKGAEVLVTGDIDHHTGLDALERGLHIIDAGHYGIEKIFIAYIREYLKRNMPDLTVYVHKDAEPFTVI